jgi:hypothetical protein
MAGVVDDGDGGFVAGGFNGEDAGHGGSLSGT